MMFRGFLLLGLIASAAAAPLMLTELVKAGKIAEARNQSRIVVDGVDMGFSGFFSVPSASGKNTNNLFFWFQPCASGCDPASAPLVQWLQGGPGAPSTFGAMAEIGNWYVDEKLRVQKRCFSWCQTRNCFFVDSPTMTGFSFQVNVTGQFDKDHIEYTQTSKDAAEQQYALLLQFFTVWPEYRPAPFYITGESYGGNYIPWLAKTVVEAPEKLNIKGISVGDPVMNAKVQWPTYATTLYAMGLIMEDERDKLEGIFQKGVQLLNESCEAAFTQWNRVWMDDGGTSCAPNCDFYYKNLTGSSMTENTLLGENPKSLDYFGTFLQAHAKEFHFEGIPAAQLNEGGAIYTTMVRSGDFCQNSSDLFVQAFLVAGLDVNVYSSSMDPLLGPPTTAAGIKAGWDYAEAHLAGGPTAKEAFYSANKTIWRVSKNDEQPAGYARCTPAMPHRFCYIVVRNAGHMTPSFMPRASYDMAERFLGGHPFDDSWFDAATPTCAQCGGAAPLAGSSLPACSHGLGQEKRRRWSAEISI